MEAKELLKNRRSIRKYKDEIVSRSDIMEVMELTRFAPSWCNYQIARYTVVQDPEKIKELARVGVNNFNYNIKTLENAKNVMILSYVKNKSGKLNETDFATNKKNSWESFDSGIACLQFCLSAFTKNIGTCIMGVIDDYEIKRIANIEDSLEVAAMITFGYIDTFNVETKRLDSNEIVSFL